MGRRLIAGKCRVAGLVIVACASCVVAAGSGWASGGLRAFLRPARQGDRPPALVVGQLRKTYGTLLASRRVAVAQWHGRREALYLVKVRDQRDPRLHPHGNLICIWEVSDGHSLGGGCGRSAGDFFAANRYLSVGSYNGQIDGVAATGVASVAFVGASGDEARVRLNADGGFIYNCPGYNACIGKVTLIRAYDRHDNLLASATFR